jgi:TolB-like protein/DNA-binding winged helix-turn-helix (wHTH) protein/tetratricopeptide (TPR) repeat protein
MLATGIGTSQQNPQSLRIGDWSFDVAAHELAHNGERIRLEPRVAGLLLYLAAHAGKPVSRAALLDALWPGLIVSDEALTNAVNKLRKAFGDERTRPRMIETIPKTGYRLIAPVRPAPAPPTTTAPAAPRSKPRGASGKRMAIATLALALAVGLAALAVVTLREANVPDAANSAPGEAQILSHGDRAAVAVLPFRSLTPHSAADHFADGLTDDLITRLAKHAGLMVIARESTFYYKGKTGDLSGIAGKLGVHYLLSGSLRRDGEVLKINAWLIDTTSGEHLWAEHYERGVAEVFDLETELVNGVLKTLAAGSAEREDPARETDDPRAYESLLLGRQHFYRFESKAENLKARAYFEAALQLDPEFATALAMLAWTYAFEAMNGWSDDRPASLQQAERIAGRALQIDPALPLAYFVRGLAYREQGEYVKALVEAQKAIQFDPSGANGQVLLATLLYYAGRPEEGLQAIRTAMQINPHHPYNYHFHLGQAYFVLHRYPEAIAALNRGLASNPASERLRVWLAAALVQSGDIEAANWEAEQVMAANPEFSIARMAQAFPFKDPADLEHFISALRLAGLH